MDEEKEQVSTNPDDNLPAQETISKKELENIIERTK